jgi:hypothetical protein
LFTEGDTGQAKQVFCEKLSPLALAMCGWDRVKNKNSKTSIKGPCSGTIAIDSKVGNLDQDLGLAGWRSAHARSVR